MNKLLIGFAALIGMNVSANAQCYQGLYGQSSCGNRGLYGVQTSVPTPPTTYNTYGNQTYGSNGTQGTTYGNQTFITGPNGYHRTCTTQGTQTTCY
ncbi:hypothetical protein V5F32_01570 [Xanthobacter oligotrophicus]|uniref:Uncharacterized protein n=1 Tax=Xanthobacter oligotrophicus TaxID=2607286 RepID=A0ABW6ZQ42_9HYPH